MSDSNQREDLDNSLYRYSSGESELSGASDPAAVPSTSNPSRVRAVAHGRDRVVPLVDLPSMDPGVLPRREFSDANANPGQPVGAASSSAATIGAASSSAAASDTGASGESPMDFRPSRLEGPYTLMQRFHMQRQLERSRNRGNINENENESDSEMPDLIGESPENQFQMDEVEGEQQRDIRNRYGRYSNPEDRGSPPDVPNL